MRRRGLTFVELLIALALLTLVGGVIAATLSGGLSIWARGQAAGTRDQAVQVAVTQLQRDLHGVRRFAPMPFDGDYDAMGFPALVVEDEDAVLGRLGYFFDSGRRRLCRSSTDARDVRVVSLKDRCRPLLTEVDRVRFSYYGWDNGSAAYGWLGAWSAPMPPLAVKVELGWREGTSGSLATQTVLVRVPLAHEKHQQ